MNMDTQTRQELILDSELISIIKVESFIDEMRNSIGISDEIYGNILVSLTEAVTNAVSHGNKLNLDKKVIMQFEKADNSLIFSIEDEGPGFDYNNLPDPTAKENLEKPSGRGVFLMMHLADMVIFSKNGSKVELQFKI
jgi:serine/threonine-protein kinase RsbW